jgi:DNA recombination protein RmuC
MLLALLIIQILTLLVLLALLLRRPAASAGSDDPRLAQLLSADLPRQMTVLDTRSEGLDAHLRKEVAQLRADTATASADQRKEVLNTINAMSATLRKDIEGFRSDNATAANQLRESVEQRLDSLSRSNSEKLEEMRKTVDEKLEKTLNTRLTQSFGEVQKSLSEVQKGLGEMTGLAVGVGDLKKVLSNVKSRGIVGEFFLGQQLEQMFTADQYIANARIKAGSQEAVEFALKVPNGPDSTLLLALDSKFPLGDWERLEEAYESGSEDDRKRAGAAFERAIRAQAKLICEKYIDPTTTLPFAIMYLPTEALYAEVMRRPALHAEVQSTCQVVIAGPSAFTMILTSFQMVFRTLKFQKNLNEIWKVFQIAQSEFEKFGGLMEKVEKQVGTVQTTLREIGGKTKTVNRAFRNASHLELGSSPPLPMAPVSTGFDGYLPGIAAGEDPSPEDE